MKKNLIVDSVIFLAFLAAMEPRLTGDNLHEWLSLGLALTLIVHILLHWSWITAVALKFVKKLFHSSRLKFTVDALLFTAMTAVMVSGLMISRAVLPALGLSISGGFAWRQIHSISADASLVLLGVHFALNWKWIVAAVRRHVLAPIAHLFAGRQPSPVVEAVPLIHHAQPGRNDD